jgi:hypothetical protein
MLTHAGMRDKIAEQTGYRPDVVAHILDALGVVVRDELVQQGEVVFRGLFRIVPTRRSYVSRPWKRVDGNTQDRVVSRIILGVRPVRSLRRQLSGVPLPG